MRIGIIGCGVIGRKHAQAARATPGAELVAVADVREEAARQVAQEHGVPQVFTDARTLIRKSGADLIVLALTANLRGKLGLAALKAGKHLLTEKPAAMNVAELRRLIAAAESAGRWAGCCSCRHSLLPSAKAAAEVVASGVLGPLRTLRAKALVGLGKPPSSPPPLWRVRHDLNAGGIMSNWGCYDLDYLLTLTGWTLRPRIVLAQTWPVGEAYRDRVAEGSNAETHVAALIRCEGGTVITLERGEFLPIASQTQWEITGERGSLRLNLLPKAGNQVVLDEADPAAGVQSRVVWTGDETWDMAHYNPIRDLVLAVREGREPSSSLRRALTIQQVTAAIYASAARGKAIAVR